MQTPPEPVKDVDILGLIFKEEMHGFFSPVDPNSKPHIVFAQLEGFPENISEFLNAEQDGIAKGRDVHVGLKVTAPDLARLVLTEQAVAPARLNVEDDPKLPASRGRLKVENGSFLKVFVRPQVKDDPRKFFCYHLRYTRDGEQRVLNGLKVLQDAPGFDSWHDTSTVYYEAGPAQDGEEPRVVDERGILRVPLDRFLGKQLPSMDVIGTDDPARKSWALLAFYKYFAGQLTDIYMQRADALKDALFKLVTEIHV